MFKKCLFVVGIVCFCAAFFFVSCAKENTENRFEDRFQDMPWDKIVGEADGQTVYFHMWGGADHINSWVTGYFADRLKDQYNITLEMVPVNNIAVTVNKILAEKQAGKEDGGSADLLWVNGENFKTLRQADLLFGPYTDHLPNIAYVNPSTLGYDFGYPIEGYESPYAAARVVLAYNSDRVPSPPADIGELADWIRANPGQFTYPAPPDHVGSVVIRHFFYYMADHPGELAGPFDEAVYNRVAPRVWDILNDVEPYLWREGNTYPEGTAMVYDLMGNGEIHFQFEYDPAFAALNIEKGRFPETIRTTVFDTGTIGNYNFLAIPFNSSSKAAAMAACNEALDPEVQFSAARPIGEGGKGTLSALDMSLIPPESARLFESLPRHPAILPPEVLASNVLPELQSEWLERIEADWVREVLQK